MNAQINSRDLPDPEGRFHMIEPADLPVRPAAGWIWHGYLPRGRIVLLSGIPKCGKTTLASVVLARMGSGGNVAGRAVSPSRAIVLSDETEFDWARRHK